MYKRLSNVSDGPVILNCGTPKEKSSEVYIKDDSNFLRKLNPNKVGLFEGIFFWGWDQFDSSFIFQEELI